MKCILDCYTDEAAGLGVPPYIGTYPRYLYGKLKQADYLTIDDLRFAMLGKKKGHKTDIRTYNLTGKDAREVIAECDELYVICGVHVPGKYLSALPGTLFEVARLLAGFKCRKILCGPAASIYGSRLEGGKKSEKMPEIFDSADTLSFDYDAIAKNNGAGIVKQIPYELIAEIETFRGCRRQSSCSFCTEPLKSSLEFRKPKDIISEVRALHANGIEHFRLGKQSDFFTWKENDIESMLKSIRGLGVKTLHIDNIDPATVTVEKVKLVVKYCTPGNIAAMGIESFDSAVVEKNNLNSTPETSMKAIRLINKFGRKYGSAGMPHFLPGVNILFGLEGETKETHRKNMQHLNQIMEEDMLIRRINVRQVAVLKGTPLYESCGDKYLKKNKKFYWKWRNEIRQKIDNPMLKRLTPIGHILKDIRMEVHDGNKTFGRQMGTYPLIVGINEKLPIGSVRDIKVVGHMLRSIIGEPA